MYLLEGTLLEACSCNVLCPCWVGEDPDLGECYTFVAYHIDSGQVGGLDVSGRSMVMVTYIPGNVLAGNWEEVVLVDDRASPSSSATRWSRSSPASSAGRWPTSPSSSARSRASRASPSATRCRAAWGRLSIPGIVEAEMEPYRSPTADVTTLRDSIFSTVPGSPAWVSKASRHRVSLPQYGMSWEYEGRNAIQAEWRIEHAG